MVVEAPAIVFDEQDDVKAAFDAKAIEGAGYRLWRL